MLDINFTRYSDICSLVSSNKTHTFTKISQFIQKTRYFLENPLSSPSLFLFHFYYKFQSQIKSLHRLRAKESTHCFVYRTRIVRVIQITRCLFKRIFGHFFFTKSPVGLSTQPSNFRDSAGKQTTHTRQPYLYK